MKNQFAIAALTIGAIVLGTNNAQAQVNPATAQTTVNIVLNDVISLGATGGAINFKYITAEDYNKDQTVEKGTSLTVTSTKKFDVKVKADDLNFTDGTNIIPVDVLKIKAKPGATKGMGGTKNEITLSSVQEGILVKDAPLGSALTLDLDYTIPAAKSSSSDILGKPAGTYTQTVTYTATTL